MSAMDTTIAPPADMTFRKGDSRIPLIVNLGMGVDSVAVLVGLKKRGIRPDLVMFADTGDEKEDTYAYIAVINAWLAKVGFPAVTIVRRPVSKTGYTTLSSNCIKNETLPSLAFGFGGCSQKWKVDAMDAFLLGRKRGANKKEGWAPALEAIALGLRPVKCIGYDAGPKDSKRPNVQADKKKPFDFVYPLRVWGWDREECIRQIESEGLPVPVKSACYMCPASKPWELMWLAAREPQKFLRAIEMEDGARKGKHGLGRVVTITKTNKRTKVTTTKTTYGVNGLWGRDVEATKNKPAKTGSWRLWAETHGILRGMEIIMPREELMRRALAEKPAYESNGEGLIQIGRCK